MSRTTMHYTLTPDNETFFRKTTRDLCRQHLLPRTCTFPSSSPIRRFLHHLLLPLSSPLRIHRLPSHKPGGEWNRDEGERDPTEQDPEVHPELVLGIEDNLRPPSARPHKVTEKRDLLFGRRGRRCRMTCLDRICRSMVAAHEVTMRPC